MRSRWAASIDGGLGVLDLLVGDQLLLVGVEPDLLQGRLELGLHRLLGVLGEERRMLADDLLTVQPARLLVLVMGDLEVGVRLEQGPPVGPERSVGVLLHELRVLLLELRLMVLVHVPLAGGRLVLRVLLLGLRGGDERAELGDQPGDVDRDLVLPRRLGPDRHQLALAVVQVEPGGADVGAIENDQHVPLLDLLAEQGMDLADDSVGPGSNLDLAVDVRLDPARHPDLGRELQHLCRLGLDARGLPLPLGERDRRRQCRRLRVRRGRRPRTQTTPRWAADETACRGAGWPRATPRPAQRPPTPGPSSTSFD